ncbi:hypothetical protein I3843_10G157000 [Carya illinoinensis]|nr:hypothetical protein I3843_10G157000 [Carya illinoinensis]
MGKNAFLSVFFFLLIVVDASLLSSFRKLVGAAPKDANATTIRSSPSPGPFPSDKKSGTSQPMGQRIKDRSLWYLTSQPRWIPKVVPRI